MKNIHGKDTKIEVILRKALWSKGYRYRKNYKKLPGRPDIALTKYKIAIFCDGEFFHGKDWDALKQRLEKINNSEFWINKISRNIERDDEINKKLDFKGWTVIRFWGEDIKKHTDECVKVVEETIFDITGEHNFQQYINNERHNNELVGFIGGPPCPDFSIGGKNKGREGENGKLAKSYIDMICRFQPDFFLFENVKGLVKTQKHREYFEELKFELKSNGYIISEQLMNSLEFGVPQDRDRIFMMGVLKGNELARKVISVNDTFAFPWNADLPYDSALVKKMNC